MKPSVAVVVLLSMWIVPTLVIGQDGDPAEFGPMDEHQLMKVGTNQPVLVIYAQANDHRILPSNLATINTSEDQKVNDLTAWFAETSWDKTTLNVTQQRRPGGEWYLLSDGILDYASPSDIGPMEARDATLASAMDPTPPTSVAAAAVTPSTSDPTSDFDATEAGDYWYAISGFKDGVESQLTRISSAVTVSEGEIVKLTITKAAANDVDRYIVYRTGSGEADSLGNYERIGYAAVTGATDEFIDRGRSLDRLADHHKLLAAAMTAADPDVADFEAFNGVIVILFSSFLRGQAAGVSSYTINGTTFKIQTINQSNSTAFGRFTHEMGHWIGLPDQYDPVTAGPRSYWTTMDGANDREYASWEKHFKLDWVKSPPNVKFLERPGPGAADFDQTYKLVATAIEETASDTYAAIKIKSSESVHYYIEGRDAVTGNVSDVNGSNDVVLMEAVDAWPPGIYPKRTLNEQKKLEAGDPAHSPDPTIEVDYVGVTAGAPEVYNVNVKIKAEERPDPRIEPWGAPPWETIDVWVDSQREGGGWEDPATAVPKPSNGEAAWVSHVNRVYARITNDGQGNATGVKVRFRVNAPGGIGDAGQFVDLPTPAAIDVPAGESRNVYAEWTPTVGDHTCIKVEIEHVPGEEDIYNNFTQENVTHFYSGSSSPWHPVTFPIRVANPFDEPKRIDLEVRSLETGWKTRFEHKWVTVDPKKFKTVDVTITPPPKAERCKKLEIDVYGMTQIDDFIQIYGGLNPIIHLADPIRFQRLRVDRTKPEKDDKLTTRPQPLQGGMWYRLRGLTDPALPRAEIAVVVRTPQGDDQVYFTETDENGAFEADFPANQPGTWSAYAYYAGDDCNAPTESDGVTVAVPVPAVLLERICCWLTILLLLLLTYFTIVLLRRRGKA